MNHPDPLCPGDETWNSRKNHCPICAMYQAARRDERRIMAEEIGNMLRVLPYPSARSPEAIAWAHDYITGIIVDIEQEHQQ